MDYPQFWHTGSSGCLLLGVSNGLFIAEPDALDELADAVATIEPEPSETRCNLGSFKTKASLVFREGRHLVLSFRSGTVAMVFSIAFWLRACFLGSAGKSEKAMRNLRTTILGIRRKGEEPVVASYVLSTLEDDV